MLSTDRTILTPGSQAAERMRAYGTIIDTLYILLAGTGAEKQIQLSPHVTVICPGGRSKVQNFFRLLDSARDLEADVISAQDPVWTGLIAVWSGKTVVQVQVHTDTWGLVGALLAPYVLAHASCVRVVSERIRLKVARHTQAKVSVLPIFVDVTPFVTESEVPIEYGHTPRILVVARLAPEKRIDSVIQVLAHIPDAHLYIVGDGPLKKSLEQLSERVGVFARVHFLGWKNNVATYYQHADCFVLASEFEGYGMVLLEAALAGCPIVSTNVGIAGELPQELVTIVSGGQYELANAIHAALTPERKGRARAAAASLRAAQGDFSLYLEEYKRLLRQCGI